MAAPAPARRRIVGVSTKMYFSAARTREYVSALLAQLSATPQADLAALRADPGVDVFIIPDHVTLVSTIDQIAAAASPVPVIAGAQDAYAEDAGAYTGEVSPAVLAEVGCRIVELGHAERRRLFGETDASAAAKAAAAARNGLTPLVCIGERTRGSSPDDAMPEVRAQVDSVLASLPDPALHPVDVVLAYEPVWAIGAAQPASADYVVAVAQAIRQLDSVRARDAATGRPGSVRLLYGGSAGPGLFEKLKDGVDGLFLGRFAHDPAQFHKTILEVAKA